MATNDESSKAFLKLPEIPDRVPGLLYPEDVEYIEEHQEEYVAWAWEYYQQGHPEPVMPAQPKKYHLKSGTLYIVRVTQFYKIGITAGSLASRLGQIQTNCPFEVELVWEIRTSDIYGLELFLHERFQERRHRGEWFRLTDTDLEFLSVFLESCAAREQARRG